MITSASANAPDEDGEPADRRASLQAAYDYYPFGMLMPNRYLEDNSQQCTPQTITWYQRVPTVVQHVDMNSENASFDLALTEGYIDEGAVWVAPEGEQPGYIDLRVNGTVENTDAGTLIASYQVEGLSSSQAFRFNTHMLSTEHIPLRQEAVQLNDDNEEEVLASYDIAYDAEAVLEGTTKNNNPVRLLLKTTGGNTTVRIFNLAAQTIDVVTGSYTALICNDQFGLSKDYRYSCNGYEKDNEIKGEGNSINFGDRIYDSRTGRFLSIDKYARKFPNESNYSFASNSPISAKDINGDSTYLVIYGAGYLNYTMAGGSHDVGNGFLLNAQALKKKIESSSTFDPNRDAVVLVYAPNASRFTAATNAKYKSGKIASMTVFSHGNGFSQTNGTNTGGVSLGGEKPGEKRPDGTTVTQADADAQKNNYDLREINGNNVGNIDGSNFESTATCTFYGCWIGGDQSWTDQQIKDFSFGQKLADNIGVTVKAFTSSGLFKTGANGKNLYDGTMIRAIDAKSQKVRLSTFKPNVAPTIIRK